VSLFSLCFNGHFLGGPGLAGTRMSSFLPARHYTQARYLLRQRG